MIRVKNFLLKSYGWLVNNKRVYAGIGSRETPVPILSVMRRYAYAVAHNHVLRTGGAPGADDAFYKGAKKWCQDTNAKIENHIEVFLPWDNFNGYKTEDGPHIFVDPPHGAGLLAAQFHPNYNRLKDSAKKLMDRNSQQIKGRLLNDTADFVVCYTSDGKASGGTGQAIRMAEAYEIPIYNLFFKESYEFCMEAIRKFEGKEKGA